MEKVFQVVHDFSLIFTYMVAITAMSRVFVAYRFRNRINKDGVKVINNIGSYYGTVLIIFTFSTYCYYLIEKYAHGMIIDILSTGLPLAFLLIIVGKVIEPLYNLLKIKDIHIHLSEIEKEYIFAWTAIISCIYIWFWDYRISLISFSVFLGKFIWYDTGKTRVTIEQVFGGMRKSNKVRPCIISMNHHFLAVTLIYMVFVKLVPLIFG